MTDSRSETVRRTAGGRSLTTPFGNRLLTAHPGLGLPYIDRSISIARQYCLVRSTLISL